MDSFNVQFSPQALSMLDDCLAYVNDELMNPQAAESIWADAIETKDSLIKWADSHSKCSDLELAALGYYYTKFLHHSYLYIYRINNHMVSIEAVYHELQDYENLFKKSI